jgi:hypothetical protein
MQPPLTSGIPKSIPRLPEGVPSELMDSLARPHSDLLMEHGGSFPVTTVEVELEGADTSISFGLRTTRLAGLHRLNPRAPRERVAISGVICPPFAVFPDDPSDVVVGAGTRDPRSPGRGSLSSGLRNS